MKVQFFIQVLDCLVCRWKKWPVRTLLDHPKLITSLLITTANYCQIRKALPSFLPILICALTMSTLQLVSKHNSYTRPTSFVNLQCNLEKIEDTHSLVYFSFLQTNKGPAWIFYRVIWYPKGSPDLPRMRTAALNWYKQTNKQTNLMK